MMRQPIDIREFHVSSIEPGSAARHWLTVAPGLVSDVKLPALIARGEAAGPTLLAVAGVHGDEYEGMEAIRRVFAALDPARMRGTFLGIPIANPFAHEARARVAPLSIDGLNLARVFPGETTGSPTRVLAAALLDLVERHVSEGDLFVDFHSGSADVPYATLVGFRDVENAGREPSEEAARHFGLPALWRIPDGPGPFNAETARRSIPTIGTETTGRAGCDPDGVEAFTRGLDNLLAYLGISEDQPRPARFDGPARPTVDVLAPAAGFLQVKRQLNDHVAAGDELGTIVDVFGDPVERLTAPIGGTIWASRSMPAIRSGELAFVIAE